MSYYRRESGRSDYSHSFERAPGTGVKDIATKSLYIQSKKFYIDIKEGKRGKFMKLAEVAPNGQKMKIIMDLPTAKEFHDHLSEFCEIYSELGPGRSDSSHHNDGNLKCETIFKEDRRYYLDLKENHRGRFLKVSMSLPNHERSQIVIPAHGMIDIRDALTDMLNEHGKDDKADGSDSERRQTLTVDNKNFHFDVGGNPRGTFLRISEVSGSFRATITVPEEIWDRFVASVDEATEQKDDPDDSITV